MQIVRYEAAGLRCVEVAPDDAANRPELPLLVMLHGLGDWGESFVDFAHLINPTAYRFVFPTAPIPLPGARFQWFGFEPAQLFEGVTQARQNINQLLDTLAARYQLPTKHISLSGFSQGAMLTLETGLRYHGQDGQHLAGLIGLSGMLLVESAVMPNFMSFDFSPYYANAKGDIAKVLQQVATDQLPVLIAHGSHDMVVPVVAARETVALLKNAGVDVTYSEFNYGHEISLDTLNLIRQFLTKIL